MVSDLTDQGSERKPPPHAHKHDEDALSNDARRAHQQENSWYTAPNCFHFMSLAIVQYLPTVLFGLHAVLTCPKPVNLTPEGGFSAEEKRKRGRKSDIHVTALPTQTWQEDTCSLTDEGMKYSFPSNSCILSSAHLYSYLLVCSQPQSSWTVICDLPDCGCNNVSTQLRIHFLGTGATNHRLESPDTRANAHKLWHRVTQIKHYTNGPREITNHCWRRKGNY